MLAATSGAYMTRLRSAWMHVLPPLSAHAQPQPARLASSLHASAPRTDAHDDDDGDQTHTIFGRLSSSNTQKVLWMFEEARVPYRLVAASARLGAASPFLVDFQSSLPYGLVNQEAYRDKNPHGYIPTVVLPVEKNSNAAALWESNTIVRYVADRYAPQYLNACGVNPAVGRALVSRWLDWSLQGNDYGPCFGSANHHLVDAIARTPPEKFDDQARQVVDKAVSQYVHLFNLLEQAIGDARTPLGVCEEEAFSIADVPIAVELNRFSLAMHALAATKNGGGGCEEGASATWPHLSAFYERMLVRPAFWRAVFLPEVVQNVARLGIAQSAEGDGYGEWSGKLGLPKWSDEVNQRAEKLAYLAAPNAAP